MVIDQSSVPYRQQQIVLISTKGAQDTWSGHDDSGHDEEHEDGYLNDR
jgi:hypothetical protein